MIRNDSMLPGWEWVSRYSARVARVQLLVFIP